MPLRDETIRGIGFKEIEKITLAYTTYQGGKREGEPLEPNAIAAMVQHFGFGPGHPEWGNQHDSACEELSDTIRKIRLLSKATKGNGGANIRIPMH